MDREKIPAAKSKKKIIGNLSSSDEDEEMERELVKKRKSIEELTFFKPKEKEKLQRNNSKINEIKGIQNKKIQRVWNHQKLRSQAPQVCLHRLRGG